MNRIRGRVPWHQTFDLIDFGYLQNLRRDFQQRKGLDQLQAFRPRRIVTSVLFLHHNQRGRTLVVSALLVPPLPCAKDVIDQDLSIVTII
jgi:hypothetical protein